MRIHPPSPFLPSITGQSGATRLAVSKALVALGKEGLEETGLLNRDPRSVERKKPGQKKARKKFTWYVWLILSCEILSCASFYESTHTYTQGQKMKSSYAVFSLEYCIIIIIYTYRLISLTFEYACVRCRVAALRSGSRGRKITIGQDWNADSATAEWMRPIALASSPVVVKIT